MGVCVRRLPDVHIAHIACMLTFCSLGYDGQFCTGIPQYDKVFISIPNMLFSAKKEGILVKSTGLLVGRGGGASWDSSPPKKKIQA